MTSQCHAETYWTESRQEIQAWFQRNAPSLGELYEGALRMFFEPQFPGRTRFVAHAVREIRNRLPDVITGQRSGGTFQWKNRLDDLEEDWKKAGLSLDGMVPIEVTTGQSIPSMEVGIPRALMRKIAILLNDHHEAREKPEEAATRLFEGNSPASQNLRDTLRPVILQWLKVTKWFVGKAHDSGVQDNDIDAKEFLRKFELFELTLGALVRSFFKTVEGLDEILEDTNS